MSLPPDVYAYILSFMPVQPHFFSTSKWAHTNRDSLLYMAYFLYCGHRIPTSRSPYWFLVARMRHPGDFHNTRRQILEFLCNRGKTKLELPCCNAYHRMRAHRFAEQFGLVHTSIETGDVKLVQACPVCHKGSKYRLRVDEFGEYQERCDACGYHGRCWSTPYALAKEVRPIKRVLICKPHAFRLSSKDAAK